LPDVLLAAAYGDSAVKNSESAFFFFFLLEVLALAAGFDFGCAFSAAWAARSCSSFASRSYSI